MHMIVGLGNPGSRYQKHRHNIGFQIVDALAAAHDFSFDKVRSQARMADGRVGAARVLLVKPLTYMNLSGAAIQPLVSFYKIELAQLMVVYDDLDLPMGQLRLRSFGGPGGHNGMRSIIQRLGDDRFPRLRAGIGRPPGRMDPADYVLQNFSEEEEAIMAQTRDLARRVLEHWLDEDIDAAMNSLALWARAEGRAERSSTSERS